MGLKRLPNSQTTEELLKTVEESEDKNVVGTTDSVFSFLSYFNILPGEQLVMKWVLYDLYKNWSEMPESRQTFSNKIRRHFFSHTIGGKTFYKINLNSFDVEKKTLEYIQSRKINKTKYPSWQKHYDSFLKFYNIKPGKKWIQSYILMHLYDKWCYKNRKKRLLSELQFFNFCKLYFKYKRNSENRMMWFGVNEEFITTHLTSETLNNLQQARKTYYGKKQKSANKAPGSKT